MITPDQWAQYHVAWEMTEVNAAALFLPGRLSCMLYKPTGTGASTIC